MKFSGIEESLLIFAGLSSQLKAALKTLVLEESIRNEDLKFTVCNHIQILLSSFLNEWKTFEGLGKDPNIRKTLKMASPALDRIRIWKGLTKIRNKILAHGHREMSGAPAWAWDVFDAHDCPTAYAETILLGNCAVIAIDVALHRYRSEYEKAFMCLMKNRKEIKDKGINTTGEIGSELDAIKSEIIGISKGL